MKAFHCIILIMLINSSCMIDKIVNCKTRYYVTIRNESSEGVIAYFADSSKMDYSFKVNLTILKYELSIDAGQVGIDSIDFVWEQADACSYMGRTSIAYRVKANIVKNDSTIAFNNFLYPYDTLKANDHNYDYSICNDCLNKAYDTITIK